MIEACFSRYNKNVYFSFEIKGHANYNDFGYDIVCAAVSSALDLTILAIKNFSNSKYIMDVNNKYAFVSFKLTDKNNKFATLLIESLYNHLLNISLEYKDNLVVKINECKE